MRPLDTAAAGDYIMEPQHLAWQAALAPLRQKAAHSGAVRAGGSSERMREQKGPFSLPEITADLLPYRATGMLRSRRSATAYWPSQRSSRGSLISAIFSIL